MAHISNCRYRTLTSMKPQSRPISSVSLLADQLQNSCLHDRSSSVGVAKSVGCCSPSHTSIPSKDLLPAVSTCCLRFENVNQRAVHFFDASPYGESPVDSSQEENVQSSAWADCQQHPRRQRKEEPDSIDETVECEQLRQYSTSAPTSVFNCQPPNSCTWFHRTQSPYSLPTTANWEQPTVSGTVGTKFLGQALSSASQDTFCKMANPYYSRSKRACRSLTCTNNSPSSRCYLRRRLDGQRSNYCHPSSTFRSVTCLLAAHFQSLPRPVAIRHDVSSHETTVHLRDNFPPSYPDVSSRLSWPQSELAPLSLSPCSEVNRLGNRLLAPLIPLILTSHDDLTPTTKGATSPQSSIHISSPNNPSTPITDIHRPLRNRASAFTPTRPVVNRRTDLQSSICSCLSSDADSVSSSLRTTLLTPSSGFHENSFSFPGEGFSLPDCSKLIGNCRDDHLGVLTSRHLTNHTVTTNNTSGIKSNFHTDIGGFIDAGRAHELARDECAFSPLQFSCQQDNHEELGDLTTEEDCYEQATLSRPISCSTARTLSIGHQITNKASCLKRRRGPSGDAATSDYREENDSDVIDGDTRYSEGEGVLTSSAFAAAGGGGIFQYNVDSPTVGQQRFDFHAPALGTSEPMNISMDVTRQCCGHCPCALRSSSKWVQGNSPSSVCLAKLPPANLGVQSTDDHSVLELDVGALPIALPCRHLHNQLDGVRELQEEDEADDISEDKPKENRHQQQNHDSTEAFTGVPESTSNSKLCKHLYHYHCRCRSNHQPSPGNLLKSADEFTFTPITRISADIDDVSSEVRNCEPSSPTVGICVDRSLHDIGLEVDHLLSYCVTSERSENYAEQDGVSSDSETMLSPQLFNRRRPGDPICSGDQEIESACNPPVFFTDIDLTLIEND